MTTVATLAGSKHWMTADELAKAMIEPARSLKTVQNALTLMRKESKPPFAFQTRDGRGGANEYHCLAPGFDGFGDNLETSHASQDASQDTWDTLEGTTTSSKNMGKNLVKPMHDVSHVSQGSIGVWDGTRVNNSNGAPRSADAIVLPPPLVASLL